jgi:cephalosporin hydroxylase
MQPGGRTGEIVTPFEDEAQRRIAANAHNEKLRETAGAFMRSSLEAQYSYNYFCMGRPIIQYPQDMVAMQEIIWSVRPDLIIESGIAHGGSLMLSASMLTLLDYCDAVEAGDSLDPTAPKRRVIGLDIDIREHNRTAIERHPLSCRIDMIQGSSTDSDIVRQVQGLASGYSRILVCLDSCHTHEHVLAELEAYAPLVSRNSYCVVFDTNIEDMSAAMVANRPWSPGNSPMTALHEYLALLETEQRTAFDGFPLRFAIDRSIENKLMLTAAPSGYLKRIG